MMDDRPLVSVIIPTHNREAFMRCALDALSTQTYPAERIDAVVVADGCTDGTVEMLRAYPTPYALRVVEQANAGPAAARNNGAARAEGALLLFLDDDVEATPWLVEGHVRAHERRPNSVVIGYLPPLLGEQRGFFRITLRRWWEDKFDAMRNPGHRYHAFDLLSGNFSLSAELFRQVGGFDPTLRVHEDYELGLRIIARGAPLVFAPEAQGRHREQTDLHGALRRKFDEGRADVLIGRLHPEVRAALPMARQAPRRRWRARLLQRLAFAWPGGREVATSLGRVGLRWFERLRLRGRWRRLMDDLLDYWYWLGVALELGTMRELERFLALRQVSSTSPCEVEVDLQAGLATAERLLDEVRPDGIRLWFGRRLVGRVLPQPGAERLRGAHLRPLLATHLARPLLEAMALEGAIGPPFDAERLLAICSELPVYQIPGIEPA